MAMSISAQFHYEHQENTVFSLNHTILMGGENQIQYENITIMNSHHQGTESPNKSHNHPQNKYKQFSRQQRLPRPTTFTNSQSIQIIYLPQQNIIKNLDIYAWRSKTYLPILKPTNIVVTPEQYFNSQNLHFQFDTSNINNQICHQNYNKNFIALKDFVEKSPHIQNYKVRVQIEEVKCKLKEVNELPLPQFLYLLKETLIGFELLFDIFGYFKVTDDMIIVNASSQWKVWISQNYRSNQKNQGFQSQKQVLVNLITLLQKHYMITNASKQLFNTLKQIVQEKQPTFLKILSKINQYISTHKVFQVNRFCLPFNRSSKPFISQKSSIQIPNHKKSSKDSRNTPVKKKEFNYFPQSPKQPYSYQQITRFTLNPNHKRFNPNEYYFKNYQTNTKPSSFQQLPKNMQKINFQTYTSQKMMILKVKSPISNKNISSFNTPKKMQKNYHLTPQNKKFTNVFNSNRSGKFFQTNRANLDVNRYQYNQFQSSKNGWNGLEVNKYRETKSPDPLKLQPPIRCNSGNSQVQLLQTIDSTHTNTKPLRKYTDNLQQIKSTNALLNMQKKIAGSSIYEAENMGKLKKHLCMNEHQPFKVKIHNNTKKSSQISPNNSSSTKQVKNSGQMSKDLIPCYLKMKQKDLGSNKMKNSLSLMSNQGRDEIIRSVSEVDKNMAISYQFQNSKKKDLNSQKKYPNKLDLLNVANENQWVNSISGLFSENVSIKHLKQSVKVKGQQEEHFEKEHLKDVKLQMLQKFGRKVDHMVVQQDLQSKYSTKNQNKSMQLIQQQMSQVKSYLQSERRQEDDLKPKQMRSKHQTMQVKVQTSENIKQKVHSDFYNSQYDDKDADSEIPSQSSIKQQIETPAFQQDNGFSFQTEMYVINPKKKQ